VITCRQLIDFIADYLAGELDVESGALFERHLEVCPSCLAYLDSYVVTMTITRHLDDEDAPLEGIPEPLVQAILRRARS
jgi:predicted anti-sigma-YlaC factor YlaD